MMDRKTFVEKLLGAVGLTEIGAGMVFAKGGIVPLPNRDFVPSIQIHHMDDQIVDVRINDIPIEEFEREITITITGGVRITETNYTVEVDQSSN